MHITHIAELFGASKAHSVLLLRESDREDTTSEGSNSKSRNTSTNQHNEGGAVENLEVLSGHLALNPVEGSEQL